MQLRLTGQLWEFEDGAVVDTPTAFAAVASGRLAPSIRCRSAEDPEWRAASLRFVLIGRYGLLRRLGEGAFGAVHLAFDAARLREGEVGRLVALKAPSLRLLSKFAEAAGYEPDPRCNETENERRAQQWARARLGQLFAQEALLTGRLATCPYVVSVLDHDITVPFLALELCNGGALNRRLKRPYELTDALRWAYQIAAALEVAHGLKPDRLIHRDLKPENILLHDDEVRIADFGTSQMAQDTTSLRSLQGGFTPLYAAPEAFDGKAYPATDVWSLGVILYEMLTRRRPFGAPDMSLSHLMRVVITEAPPPLEGMSPFDLPPELVELVEACLEKDTAHRPTAAEASALLAELVDGPPQPADPPVKPARLKPAQRSPAPAPPQPWASWVIAALLLSLLILSALIVGRTLTASAPTLSAPTPGAIITTPKVTLSGVGWPLATVRCGDAEARCDRSGSFRFDALLAVEGAQELRVQLIAGEESLDLPPIPILVDISAPRLELETVLPEVTREPSLALTGEVADLASITRVRAGGEELKVEGGRFAHLWHLKEGANQLELEAEDGAGHTTRRSLSVVLDTQGPALELLTPLEGRWITTGPVLFTGRVEGAVELELDGVVSSSTEPEFELRSPYPDGEREVVLKARDAVGNTTTLRRLLRIDANPPVIDLPADAVLETDASGSLVIPVADPHLTTFSADKGHLTKLTDSRWRLRVPARAELQRLRLEARDAAGHVTTRSLWLRTPDAPPPDAERARALLADRTLWAEASAAERESATAWVAQRLGPRFDLSGADEWSCGGARHWIPSFQHRPTGIRLNLIPGGRFRMGSPDDEAGRADSEGPAREVLVPALLIGVTEVTQAQWQRAGGLSLSAQRALAAPDPQLLSEGPSQPMSYVSWEDAQAWLRGCGGGLRLPSEAEWEYACRAGTTSPWCFGDDPAELGRFGWVDQAEGLPQAVATKLPNAFGLYDMHGNVWEWCLDAWFPDYTDAPAGAAPRTQRGARRHPNRGGSWCNEPMMSRSAARLTFAAGYRFKNFGLRVARSLD